jgi:hypothetical protein
MEKRKLEITSNEVWDNGESYIDSPGVVVSTKQDGRQDYFPTHAVYREEVDGKPNIGVASINGDKLYPVKSYDEVNVSASKGDITFSSYSRIYTVRAFQDSDGLWASRLRMPVPAEALEELYMAEVAAGFSPGAPGDTENLYAAVEEKTDEVKYLVYSAESGIYTRSSRAWFRLPADDDETLDDLQVLEVDPKFVKYFDKSEKENKKLTADDVARYEIELRGGITASGLTADADYGDACPPATIDLELNLKNRQYAIDKIGYGPLNPNEPSEEFWAQKAERWSVTIDDAKTSRCGNCAVFNKTTKILNCISDGLNEGGAPTDDWSAAIDQAELGYCEMLDFKCAASRTCDAWVVGGPIEDAKDDYEQEQ